MFNVAAGAVTAAAGGRDQELVLFYAVSVFLSRLAGLAAMAVFSPHDRRRGHPLLNVLGARVVTFTLVVNLARGPPLASLGASLLIAGVCTERGSRQVAPVASATSPLSPKAERSPRRDVPTSRR